jgi:hypothetical protein
MEIVKLTGNALRIKGKKSTFLIDVTDLKKTEANAYLFLKEDVSKAGYSRETLLISGPGDYEISGAKVSALRIGKAMFYMLNIDGVKMLLTSASSVSLGKEKLDEQHVVLLDADTVIDQSAITNLSPVLAICYGEKATELAASLGKGLGKKDADEEGASKDADVKPVDKFSVTADKLPAELQVVLLS